MRGWWTRLFARDVTDLSPTKKTPQAVARMLATARSGLPLKFVAQAGGIAYDVFLDWRNRDSEFDQALEQARLASVQERWEQIMKLGKGTEEKPGDWKALAWSLERTEASSFARPEIQLIQQNNMTENHLSITINAEELRQIEAEGLPERQRVQEMFAAYRQGAVDYNDGEKKRILQAEPVKEPSEDEATQESVPQKFAQYKPKQPVVLPPIVRKEGDENRESFWFQFTDGDGSRLVEKRTALFTVKQIVFESVGPRYCQSVVFDSETITVRDVLRAIERLSGPAGWQLILRKSGYIAHS